MDEATFHSRVLDLLERIATDVNGIYSSVMEISDVHSHLEDVETEVRQLREAVNDIADEISPLSAGD
jgi:archaellum component FlaC